MRRAALSIALFVLALGAGITAAGQSAVQIPSHPRELKYPRLDYAAPKRAGYRHVLRSGVVAYLVEDHELPLATVSALVRGGSYLDPPGKEGLASAVGSQIRSGGTARRKAEEFDEEADFLAAGISSSLGSTSGSASVNVLSKDIDKGLELFFEMLKQPGFQADRLELYRGQVLQQLERRNDRTEDIEAREWSRLIRGERHFSSRLPTKASVSSITRDDLVAFHRKNYHPGNFIVAVSGDFKTDEMKAKLDRYLTGWPSGEAAPPVPKPDHKPVPGLYLVHKADVNQGRASLGHLGIQRGNPDEFAIDLMNDILGGAGFTSRIMNRVRTEEGLAYDAGTSFAPGIYYPGTFRAQFQSKNASVAEAMQIVLDEIEKIRKDKVRPDELDAVKNNAVEVFPRYFASARAIAGTFADDELTARPMDYWEKYRDRVRAVTADDVLRVAREYLHPEWLVILVVGNVDEILRGNSDRPQYSLAKLAPGGKLTRIPLPDPATQVYPK